MSLNSLALNKQCFQPIFGFLLIDGGLFFPGQYTMRTIATILIILSVVHTAIGKEETHSGPDRLRVWTNPDVAANENRSFALQGEYYAVGRDNYRYFIQVRASEIFKRSRSARTWYSLERFSAELYRVDSNKPKVPALGELESWERVCSLSGRWHREEVWISKDEGPYKAKMDGKSLHLFDATFKNGRQPIAILSRVKRQSPTLDAKAPSNATILFDGSSNDHWNGGQVRNNLLYAPALIESKQSFSDYKIHLEFRHPYMPDYYVQQNPHTKNRTPPALDKSNAKGHILHQRRYSIQFRDTFCLLDPQDNSTSPLSSGWGSVNDSKPRTNICLSPLMWQTYDAEFTAARFDDAGNLVKPAEIVAFQNGVLIHKRQKLPEVASIATEYSTTAELAPLCLLSGRHPIYYRNVWVIPK